LLLEWLGLRLDEFVGLQARALARLRLKTSPMVVVDIALPVGLLLICVGLWTGLFLPMVVAVAIAIAVAIVAGRGFVGGGGTGV
jgi:hypothetical protein